MIYTGIGSRKTPDEVLKLMEKIAKHLSAKGWILRSGGADGADTAFERGHIGDKEIYLPFPMFRGNKSQLHDVCGRAMQLGEAMWESRRQSAETMPSWNFLKYTTKLFMARNCYQILGKELEKNSDLVICWTPDGEKVGGTAQAIHLAESLGIPVLNLALRDIKQDFNEILTMDLNIESYLEKWREQVRHKDDEIYKQTLGEEDADGSLDDVSNDITPADDSTHAGVQNATAEASSSE